MKLRYVLIPVAAAAIGFAVCGRSDDEQHEAGEVLLKIKDSAKLEYAPNLKKGELGIRSLDKISKEYGVRWAEQVFDTVDDDSMRRVYQLEFADDADIEDIIKDLQKDPAIEYVEADGVQMAEPPEEDDPDDILINDAKKFIPNDPMYSRQWGLEKIKAPYAWKKHDGKYEPVVVAIIDTGVDYNHPDLAANMLRDAKGKVKGYNFVKNNADPMDGNMHGTHCAGIVAALINNKVGGAGTGAHIRIMPVKGLSDSGSGYAEDLADSLVWATQQGADVLSNSWGSMMPSSTIRKAVEFAQKKGKLVVAAAGNSDTNQPHFPCGYTGVLGVAATDQDDEKASFSNFGKRNNQISAPGVAILSTLPHDKYGSLSGTSMATPFVAAVAAEAKARNRKLTADQLKRLLVETADKVDEDEEIGPRINLEKLLDRASKY